MIQEYVREMSAEERESLQPSARPIPPTPLRVVLRPAATTLVIFAVAAIAATVWTGGVPRGGLAAALGGLFLLGVYDLGKAVVEDRRMRKRRENHETENAKYLAGVLADGRVRVKRVRAVAVVEMEALEDEGTGYFFDLGDGRVLALKGQDYPPLDDDDDDAPWPNTEFEIVRTMDGEILLDVHRHGRALPPLRVLRAGELDPQAAWDEREEVLEMSLDDAVKTVLRAPAP